MEYPEYNPEATIICACGNTFTTAATMKEIHVELCSACHPFFTGRQVTSDDDEDEEKFGK